MKFQKDMLRLYAVTDRKWTGRRTLCEQIEDALKGGATMIQLREKSLPEEELIEEGIRVKEVCRRYRVPLIINDHVKAAFQIGADGVHVGIEDTPVAEIRKAAGNDFIIGATAKTVAQAKAAEAAGADYLGVGAVFPSSTKENAIRITTEQLKGICASVSIPAAAIGGITLSNLPQLRGGGMSGIAVVSAVFAETDITAAALRLKEAVTDLIETEEAQ